MGGRKYDGKLLIVDDDKDILTTFKKGLEGCGYLADVYDDPEMALKNFKPNYYDFLLIDILMPKMDGFRLFKEIQKLDPDAQACFVTAFENYFGAFKEIFPDLEVGLFIKKPIAIGSLARLINHNMHIAK